MATKFTATVNTAGGGTSYNSLSAAEAGLQCDLTAATTKVFSHGGITGTINDNASVTGKTSGATATVVHCTSSQILLENISGTFQSGEQVYVTQDTDYVVISDAGDSAYVSIECQGGVDSTYVVVDGWTTDSSHYVEITVVAGERHSGTYPTSGYRLEVADPGAIRINNDYVKIFWLPITATNNGAASRGIRVYYADTITIGYCIVRGTRGASPSDAHYGISVFEGSASVFNCIVYDFPNGGVSGIGLSSRGTLDAYNCTVHNCEMGFSSSYGRGSCTNCVIFECDDDFDGGTIVNCASDDGDGTNAQTLDSSDGYANEFADAANHDYSLVSGSVCIDNGTSDPGSGLYSDDIVGTSRPQGSGWDIGAFEKSAGLSETGLAASASASAVSGDTAVLADSGLGAQASGAASAADAATRIELARTAQAMAQSTGADYLAASESAMPVQAIASASAADALAFGEPNLAIQATAQASATDTLPFSELGLAAQASAQASAADAASASEATSASAVASATAAYESFGLIETGLQAQAAAQVAVTEAAAMKDLTLGISGSAQSASSDAAVMGEAQLPAQAAASVVTASELFGLIEAGLQAHASAQAAASDMAALVESSRAVSASGQAAASDAAIASETQLSAQAAANISVAYQLFGIIETGLGVSALASVSGSGTAAFVEPAPAASASASTVSADTISAQDLGLAASASARTGATDSLASGVAAIAAYCIMRQVTS